MGIPIFNSWQLTLLLFVSLLAWFLLPQQVDAATALVNLVSSNDSSQVSSPLDKDRGTSSSGVLLDQESSSDSGQGKKRTLADFRVAVEQFMLVGYWRLTILTFSAAFFPYDVTEGIERLTQGSGFESFWMMSGLLLLVFTLAAGIEYGARRTFFRQKQPSLPDCAMAPIWRLWSALLMALPEFFGILIFTTVSYCLYLVIYAPLSSRLCPLYFSLLATIIVARLVNVVFKVFFSPSVCAMRFLPLDKRTATIAYRSLSVLTWVLVFSIMLFSLFKYLGVWVDTALLLRLFFGTLIIALICIMVVLNRELVRKKILMEQLSVEGQWFALQVADKWQYLAIGYFALLWLFWAGRLTFGEVENIFAFSISLFIVPFFFIFDSLLSWFLRSARSSLSARDEEEDEMSVARQERGTDVLFSYVQNITRLILITILFIWFLALWGVPITFGHLLMEMATKVFVILALFFIAWRIINSFITMQLDTKRKEQETSEEDVDSEWGDSPLLDRSQTLLPIVRKFIGIFLLVLIVLFILSSLGVNIGPLLAGAGVIGIAIGFGAQKLVSDLLSGFFYLVDDAFRVGEYIEAGAIAGSVEKITLRNVMLRHHRGMLQIIPYGDLGAITNYMRGGIVVKFNLQFPYDTDVDLVRKIIKRVGISMLDDPEYGKNFVKQMKSQGIREVGDSVLTIRVKFTANPGTHFVIRREAYRRITEALTEKGIFYAHRKVIVEVPSLTSGGENGRQQVSPEVHKAIAEAGAAADRAQVQRQLEQAVEPIS